MSHLSRLSRLLVGKPLPTSAHAEERLNNFAALAILASDALSSVAYATEEILLVLIHAGSVVLGFSLPIAALIILLLSIVTFSYRQTIQAYPQGGGAYKVAKENISLYAGLTAAAALLIDYVLTVTVSVSAGIAALTSAFPSLYTWRIDFCLLAIFLLMLANLRGVKDAGRVFMVPTYGFIFFVFLLLIIGLYKLFTGQIHPEIHTVQATQTLSLFLILRAFSAGCTALTGVEAISDGVMVFKDPEWKNARLTLIYMSGILGVMFLGITYLTHAYHVIPSQGQTVLSLLGREIFDNDLLYYSLQTITLLILLLAANTSFADFPRLSYFLAQDGFLPRQLSLLGDRLVYANGIRLLSLASVVLIIIFKGEVNALIPLYAVGVFTSFTLSQAGMVRHWFKDKQKGWRTKAFINGLGAVTTLGVLTVIILTKFLLGAWLVVVSIPVLVIGFLRIYRHYQMVGNRLRLAEIPPLNNPYTPPDVVQHPAIVLVSGIHHGTIEALNYAISIADEVVAVHVDIGTTNREKLLQKWEALQTGIYLEILDSPYRSIVQPLSKFISSYEAEHPEAYTTIILPVLVTRRWWEELLHNQTSLFLRAALRVQKTRIVTSFRYYL